MTDEPYIHNNDLKETWGNGDKTLPRLVTARPDKELAEDLRSRISEAVEPLLALFTEAKAKGFDVTYIIQMDGMGRAYLHTLKIMKEF